MGEEDDWFSEAQLQARRPVWSALSDMYLDTDVSLSREWRIKILAESPYSLDELDAILCDEIHPVCISNMFDVAGEWAGFDRVWLERAIRGRSNREEWVRPTGWFSRLMGRARRITVDVYPGNEWAATRHGIIALRTQASEPA
ncbi:MULTISPECIES: DUF7079 family protein [Nitrospirillum]|uniref:DUF7079 family protein n=1 Tax=Nitrospirillum amazonense TaxID=28077 RepID=UPI0011A48637|nr:hypothetical protein [Nitrospirillum amazonense]MEC4593693.1 hypothetical protein [Nitrospirillum amazonense]